MIDRYSRPEMKEIWSENNKYRIWCDIEVFACEAQAKLGFIPKTALKSILQARKLIFDPKKIESIEKITKHDVIAFLSYVADQLGEDSRFLHKGMTSSDVLDTCFSVQLAASADLLISGIDGLLTVLDRRAHEHKNTICIGRSHGVHAEPTTFGLKLAQAYAEMERNKNRLRNAKSEINIGAISGAVGTFANIDPQVEEYVCKKLGLKPETISTQIIPRDRHAVFFATLGIIASSIDRISTEIRHLQRTEVLEVEEFFSSGQKGSSAMPHKRNPVLSENLSGLSRLVRMAVVPSMENVSLWHERDISHSSVERNIGPDATITLDFALNRLTNVIDKLIVYSDNMKKNINQLNGLIYSQRVLLALTEKGVSREVAYKLVQSNAMKVWSEKIDFLQVLKADNEVSEALSEKELSSLFEIDYHTKYVNQIFKKVFQKKLLASNSSLSGAIYKDE